MDSLLGSRLSDAPSDSAASGASGAVGAVGAVGPLSGALSIAAPDAAGWHPDILPGFVQRPIGPATLVKSLAVPNSPRGVILHIHGYNDYFFQSHFAQELTDAGYIFYAVDLRNAGRSLRPDGLPHFATDLHQPATDVAAAAEFVRDEHPELPLVVHAHSTGGLIAALWAHAYRNETGVKAPPEALVLDAPFFEVPGTFFKRAGAWAAAPAGRLRPTTALSASPSAYSSAMHVDNGGRWSFDTSLKNPDGVPIRLGWLRAVRAAQGRVDRGLDIKGPVLLAASAASSGHDPMLADSTDTVLDVSAITSRADKLGSDVTVLQIPGAVHDLTLSADEPRAKYFTELIDWLDKCISISPPVADTPSL